MSIDVTKKLIQRKKINIEGGESRWVNFKYKRLPNFCYRSGLLDHTIKECTEGSLVNGAKEEGKLQYGAWLRGDPWQRHGGDTTKAGRGRGQVHRQRYIELEAVKIGEARRVIGAEQGEEGEQVLSLSGVKINALGEEFPKSISQCEVGSGLHESGKVNLRLEKVGEKEAILGDECLRIPTTQSDTMMAMQWEKAEVDKTEPLFKFKLAPNKSPA